MSIVIRVYCFDTFWIDISECLFLLVAGSLFFCSVDRMISSLPLSSTILFGVE